MTASAAQSQRSLIRTSERVRKRKEATLAYVLLLPVLVIILAFTVFPIIFGFIISLYNWRIGPREFLGLGNYARALRPASELWPALVATISYALISVPVQLSIALVLAYLLFQKLRGKTFFRVALFLPYVTSTVASAAVWARLYSPDLGIFNQVLKALGLAPARWLLEARGILEVLTSSDLAIGGPSLAMLSVILYTTWVFVGYDMTIFLAGLGNIPNDVYEAAKIDGANGWQLFTRITWPLLTPTTFFLSLITIIGTFKAFNHIWVMTQGDNGTGTVSILIFRQLYEFQRAGYASALAFLLSTVILIITIAQNRLAANRVNY
jgi:ABC-type sugar transport system permease subunit